MIFADDVSAVAVAVWGGVASVIVGVGLGARKIVDGWVTRYLSRKEREEKAAAEKADLDAKIEADRVRRLEEEAIYEHDRKIYGQEIEPVVMMRAVRLWECVKRIGLNPFVQRIVMWSGSNGGGLPKAGEVYTVRALHGWREDGHPDPIELYRDGVQVDHWYIEAIAKMHAEGKLVVNTATLPPCMIRRLYKQEGVEQAIWYSLRLYDRHNHWLLFLSVASYKGAIPEEEAERYEIWIDVIRRNLAGANPADPGSDVHRSLPP